MSGCYVTNTTSVRQRATGSLLWVNLAILAPVCCVGEEELYCHSHAGPQGHPFQKYLSGTIFLTKDIHYSQTHGPALTGNSQRREVEVNRENFWKQDLNKHWLEFLTILCLITKKIVMRGNLISYPVKCPGCISLWKLNQHLEFIIQRPIWNLCHLEQKVACSVWQRIVNACVSFK